MSQPQPERRAPRPPDTTPGVGDPDAVWRRRPDADDTASAQPQPSGGGPDPPRSVYEGPPRAVPPPPGYRTPTVVEPALARELPEQDIAAIEAEEREALTFSYGVGLLAGAVMIVMLVVVCARLVA